MYCSGFKAQGLGFRAWGNTLMLVLEDPQNSVAVLNYT